MTSLIGGIVIVALISAIAALGFSRTAPGRLWGDEGTFLAMTASLAHDGDLIFDERDLERLEERAPGPTPAVILQRTEKGITFSKPVLYPILTTPLYSLLGDSGMVATNAGLLTIGLALFWRRLRRLAPPSRAFWNLTTVTLCSVLLLYVGWKMSDIAQTALVMIGLVLTLRGLPPARDGKPGRARGRYILPVALGGALLGVAVSMRLSTAALVAAPVITAVLYRRYRRALIVAGLALAAFLLVSGATHRLLGTANPYKAVRSSFDTRTGYPVGPRVSETMERFSTRPATQSAGWLPRLDLERSAYSLLYFFVGRHTGLLAYFPIVLVLLFHVLRRPSRVGTPLLAATGVIAAFYLLWMPDNYFGGSTFLGNRYFLVTLPAVLVAIQRPPPLRYLTVAWILALGFGISGLYSRTLTRDLDTTSQSHAHAGLFRLLPFESTARNIDGVMSHYWRGDFVRSVDPFAWATDQGLRLEPGMPPAELVVATSWPGESVKLAVRAASPEALLEVTDWQRSETYPLDGSADVAPGVLEIQLSPAWRRHGFWWDSDADYLVRSFRLSVVDPDGEEIGAEVRYLGRRLPPRMRPGLQDAGPAPGAGEGPSEDVAPGQSM